MKIYNSLTREIEEFSSINPKKVGMYTCGPTVYDYMHIGNLRTFVLSDVLYRALRFEGYEVRAVQNITDIDDKIIKRAKEKKMTIGEVAKKYTDLFLQDVGRLNINLVSGNQPKATEYVAQIISYVQILVEKGYAYVEKDGSVYFDISKFSNYGKLSRLEKRELKTGTRILSDEYTKDDVQDFALWKSVPREDSFGFESPWGWGRPGWHIECSVMSQEAFGETFDIHIGGIDLIFPHHENEIAQSEAKTGKKFVNYFVHGAHMTVDGVKMSKSLGNFYKVEDVIEKGYEPLDLRYLYLTTHYRKQMNFTWEALGGARQARIKMIDLVATYKLAGERTVISAEKMEKVRGFQNDFKKALEDDLNMPQALAVAWAVIKSNIPDYDKYDLLTSFDEVMGLGLREAKVVKHEIPDEVRELMKKREIARKSGDFSEADRIRDELDALGWAIFDTSTGATAKKK